MSATLDVPRCTICATVAHVSETDEEGRCANCARKAGEPHVLPDLAWAAAQGGTPMKIVKADRSYSNESAGREMWGALVREGVVLCYFPDQRAAFAVADLLDIRMPSLHAAVAAVAWDGPAASRTRMQR